MTVTYSGNPASSPNDAIRFEIQDVLVANPLLQDEEIAYSLIQESGTEPDDGYSAAQILSAAAHCCEALVRRFTAQADTELGSLKVSYTKLSANYLVMAAALRARAQGMQGPYVGGLSKSDDRANRQDPDRVQPAFTRDEFNNPWAGSQNGTSALDPADIGPPFPD